MSIIDNRIYFSARHSAPRISPLIVVLLLLLLLLAACGGDNEVVEETPAASEAPANTVVPTNTAAPVDTPVPTETPLEEESPMATPDDRGAEESPMATPDDRGIESPLATSEPSGETMPSDDALAQLIERAQQQLSEETGAAVDEITVAESEEVEWPDASLGCPEPGMMYATVVTPGYRIVLEAGGESYEFHTTLDPEGQIVQCGA